MESMDRQKKVIFQALVALWCGISFFAIAYKVLTAAHPADDAYILFRYAENTAAGHGIVFNAGGPRTEGATDFLWFLLLVVGVLLGVDVAIAAAALNGLGAALAGWLLADLCWGDPPRSNWVRAPLCAALPAVFLSGAALSAYVGFASMLYSALILLLFAIAVRGRGRLLMALPVLALTVALYRPDGVVVGALFASIGLWRARAEGRLRQYAGVSAACALVGLAYFLWRWHYFGLLLPLPLYVKQHAAHSDGFSLPAYLPGLIGHWKWLVDPRGPRFILAGIVVLLIYTWFHRDAGTRRLLVSLLPIGGLLAEFAFAVQSQNVQWRFQSPAHLVLVYALLHLAGKAIDAQTGPATRSIVAVLTAAAILPSVWVGRDHVRLQVWGAWNVYLETFAAELGPQLGQDTVIALTEAGVLPYFTRARIVDVVGLNHAETALRPRSASYIRDLDPDMVFFHHAHTLDNATLIAGKGTFPRIVPIEPETLRRALHPSHREMMRRGPTTYRDAGLPTTEYAAVLLAQFLSESSDYEILAVDFKGDGNYVHIYGLKRDWALRNKAIEELRASMRPGNYRPYLDVRRAMAARRSG